MAFLADPMFALFLSLSGGYLIGRISFGPFWQAALAVRAREILSRWR